MLLRHIGCVKTHRPWRFVPAIAASQRRCSTATRCLLSCSTRPYAKPRALQQPSTLWHATSQRRGAKRKATVTLDDMPQGVLDTDTLLPQENAEPEYPPLLQQVRNNMLKFSHCVLVTRVGGFYEVSMSCVLWIQLM